MFVDLYHPVHGKRRFWEGDAVELLKFGWYDDPDKFPQSLPESNLEAEVTETPKRRGRKPK